MRADDMFEHFDKKIEGLYSHIDKRAGEVSAKVDGLAKDHGALDTRLHAVEKDQAVSNIKHGILASLTGMITGALTAAGFHFFGGTKS